jgi:hypothetical protein
MLRHAVVGNLQLADVLRREVALRVDLRNEGGPCRQCLVGGGACPPRFGAASLEVPGLLCL